MTHTFFVLLGAAVLSLSAQAALATPVSVLLHPGGALVQEEATLTPDPNGTTLRFILPPAADPQSLDLLVPDHTIRALRFETIPPQDAPVVDGLKKQLDEIRRSIREVQEQQTALEARRAYWRDPPILTAGSEALVQLDALLEQRLQALGRQAQELSERLENLTRQAAQLEEQIQEAGGDESSTQQAVVELSKAAAGPVNVRYAYNLDKAGWRSLYRLEARPDHGEVKLSLEAELWQRSGQNWTGVPLILSTADPRQGMTPPRLSDWIIRPQPAAQPMPMSRASNDMLLASSADTALRSEATAAAGKAAPLYMDGSSFESWDMGKQDVPTGPLIRLPLKQESIKADFSYLLRPSRTETAYLSARLNLPELRHFPAGEALFLVDGVSVGKAPFSLSGDDSRIFFGRDPQVTAVMKKNSQQSGKQGIIDRKQTYLWDWTITVHNGHKRPVQVRVEEPAPQSRDEQITISVQSRPEASPEEHNLIWDLEVPAGKSSSISHKVTLSAPADMTLWEGR